MDPLKIYRSSFLSLERDNSSWRTFWIIISSFRSAFCLSESINWSRQKLALITPPHRRSQKTSLIHSFNLTSYKVADQVLIQIMLKKTEICHSFPLPHSPSPAPKSVLSSQMKGISHLMILVEGRQLLPLDRKPCFLNILQVERGWGSTRQVTACWMDSSLGHGEVPQRDWNCTECLRHIWHTGQRWQCAVQLSEAAENRSSPRSIVQHQGCQCCEQWCLCSPAGEEVPVWDPTRVGLRILFPAVASGRFSGLPWNKPKTTSVPLSVTFRTIWNFFSSIQNYLRIPCRETSESKDSETFPSALLWLIYNIESVYGVLLLIWYTSVLQNNHHHSFIWQLNHVT